MRVACLTCCGAILSTFPSLPEVGGWLSDWPWLLVWCTSLLKPSTQSAPHPLLTQALQVLTAAAKFYFSSLVLVVLSFHLLLVHSYFSDQKPLGEPCGTVHSPPDHSTTAAQSEGTTAHRNGMPAAHFTVRLCCSCWKS